MPGVQVPERPGQVVVAATTAVGRDTALTMLTS